MTEMRDARLHKALRDAPDDDARPSRATRDAILSDAHGAVRRRRTVSWWQRWGGSDSTKHIPWNAAFATLALATLVTVIWRGREVPDARLDSASPTAASFGTKPAVATAPPLPAAAPAPETAAATKAPPAGKQVATDSPQRPKRPAAKEQPSPPTAAAESKPALQGEARGTAAEGAAQAPVAATVTTNRRAADAAAGALQDEAARAAPAPRMASQFQSAVAGPTALRITFGNRVVDAPLAPSSRITVLIGRVTATSPGSEPLEAPVDTRIELLRDGLSLGVLELAGLQVRWSPVLSAEPGRTARPDAALLQSLRDELARLAR